MQQLSNLNSNIFNNFINQSANILKPKTPIQPEAHTPAQIAAPAFNDTVEVNKQNSDSFTPSNVQKEDKTKKIAKTLGIIGITAGIVALVAGFEKGRFAKVEAGYIQEKGRELFSKATKIQNRANAIVQESEDVLEHVNEVKETVGTLLAKYAYLTPEEALKESGGLIKIDDVAKTMEEYTETGLLRRTVFRDSKKGPIIGLIEEFLGENRSNTIQFLGKDVNISKGITVYDDGSSFTQQIFKFASDRVAEYQESISLSRESGILRQNKNFTYNKNGSLNMLLNGVVIDPQTGARSFSKAYKFSQAKDNFGALTHFAEKGIVSPDLNGGTLEEYMEFHKGGQVKKFLKDNTPEDKQRFYDGKSFTFGEDLKLLKYEVGKKAEMEKSRLANQFIRELIPIISK